MPNPDAAPVRARLFATWIARSIRTAADHPMVHAGCGGIHGTNAIAVLGFCYPSSQVNNGTTTATAGEDGSQISIAVETVRD
jgi:hypothetical protein